jgi:hypothetical protein
MNWIRFFLHCPNQDPTNKTVKKSARKQVRLFMNRAVEDGLSGYRFFVRVAK